MQWLQIGRCSLELDEKGKDMVETPINAIPLKNIRRLFKPPKPQGYS